MKLGMLKPVPLRNVWKHEAADFSQWLVTKEGMELLGKAVGIEIEPLETESAVGRYSLDILAKVAGTDQIVVIENQIEDSNHDHLGKLVTYAAGKGATCAIWIVKTAREEHRRAIEFLNSTSNSSIRYFLLEIEAWQIGESAYAPKFNAVEVPNNWAREMRDQTSTSEINLTYQKFWTEFCEYANKDQEFMRVLKLRKPLKQNWMDFAIGTSGVWLSANVSDWYKRIRVAVVVAPNFDRRDVLVAHKEDLEKRLGVELIESQSDMKTMSMQRSFDISELKSWRDAFSWYCGMLIKTREVVKGLLSDK